MRAWKKWREILMRLIRVVLMAWDLDALGTRWLEECRALTRDDLINVREERGLRNQIKKMRDRCWRQEVGIFYEGEEKALHSRGGRTPFILIQVVRITGQCTYSCAARPKLLGKVHKNRKKKSSSSLQKGKRRYKNKDFTHTIPLQNLRTRDDSGNVQHQERSICVRYCHPQCGHPVHWCSTLPSSRLKKLWIRWA